LLIMQVGSIDDLSPVPAPPTPTATPVPQVLGRVFPEGFHGQAIWSDASGVANVNDPERGWICPGDPTRTNCSDRLIHFDVSLPAGFGPDDVVLSPVDGRVSHVYNPGQGEGIIIIPEPRFDGVAELLANRGRIDSLAKGIFEFEYGLDDVSQVDLLIAHAVPLVEQGQRVGRGQPIAKVEFNVWFNPVKIAYVIGLRMTDGTYWHFGPCDVPNEDEFCGKCTPGSPYCP